MSVDDFVKIMLVAAISFGIAGISFQIMRLIGKVTDSLQDLRRTFQNVSKASDMALEDYSKVRGILDNVLNVINNLQENLLAPLKNAGAVLGIVDSFLNRKSKPEKAEQKSENYNANSEVSKSQDE